MRWATFLKYIDDDNNNNNNNNNNANDDDDDDDSQQYTHVNVDSFYTFC